MKNTQSSKELFNFRVLVLLLFTFISLAFYAALSTVHNEKIGAQVTPQLGAWHTTSPFPGDGSPYGSFVRNGIYYVNTTYTTGNPARKETYMGTPDSSGNITNWTKAWDWHGGTHGFDSATVQWSGSEQKVFMLRNGHIAEYVFNADGTINGNDYKFWNNEGNLQEAFDGRLFVWDSIVFAPLTTGNFIYETGGFSCPGHGCVNTCTDAACASADVNYKNSGNIYFQKIPFVHWNASEQFYKFKYTGLNHPDWVQTVDNIDAPGKSVFYAPNGGTDYGFIYTTRNRHLSLHSVRVNSDGSLGAWAQEPDLLPATDTSQGGSDRGDLFIIGNTLFVARGRRVYSASLDPTTGHVGAWDDSVPDLPEDQIRVMGWGKDNEGSMWGVIGNYVYLTGQTVVFYSQITGGPTVTPIVAASPTPSATATVQPTASTTSTVTPGTTVQPTSLTPGATGQPTTTITSAVSPTPNVSPTRPAGSCATAEIPGFTAPVGGGAYPGKVKIAWTAVNTAESYAVRIDDIGNPWNGSCTSPNAGDLCVDNIPKGTTSTEFTGVEGHTYHFWIHSINACGEWSKPNDSGVTTPPITSATTCDIQGYRTLIGPIDQASLTQRWGYHIDTVNPNNSLTLWVSDAIKQQQVTVAGVTPNPIYESNPYFLIVPGDKTYTVSITPLSGYTISSTYCNNQITCHIYGTSNTTLQQGASRTITCPAGGFADLWWNFTPDTFPTTAVSPTAVPTTTLAPPTPTACPAVPDLAWREGETHYTRTVVSYDGTGSNVVETISLHLKQITQSGVTVEASTDNGATWAASESSENDDHFVTIKNRNTEVIHLQVRLMNACTQTSTVLTEDVATVPLPSTAMTATPTVASGTGGTLSPATIAAIAAAVVAALIAAGFLVKK